MVDALTIVGAFAVGLIALRLFGPEANRHLKRLRRRKTRPGHTGTLYINDINGHPLTGVEGVTWNPGAPVTFQAYATTTDHDGQYDLAAEVNAIVEGFDDE